MKTIYLISGGGQLIQQCIQESVHAEIPYTVIENSDYPELHKCDGQNFYTNYIWHTDFETLLRWADEWAGCEVNLVRSKSAEE